jgi:hypothetical protein
MNSMRYFWRVSWEQIVMGNDTKELQEIEQLVHQLAERSQGDTLELLGILRFLEQLHRDLSESVFQESLPTNRQALYALLKDIEANGGWPYIYRLRLQELLHRLEPSSLESLGIPAPKPTSEP